jgi:hypothetical protein
MKWDGEHHTKKNLVLSVSQINGISMGWSCSSDGEQDVQNFVEETPCKGLKSRKVYESITLKLLK